MFYTFTDRNGLLHSIDMDDKRFRIRPYQQMLSSCSGALLTSLLSEYAVKFTGIFSTESTNKIVSNVFVVLQ